MTSTVNAPFNPMFTNADTISTEVLVTLADSLMGTDLFKNHKFDTKSPRVYGRHEDFQETAEIAEFIQETLTHVFDGQYRNYHRPDQIAILDPLCFWLYRSTDGKLRDAFLMLSWALAPLAREVIGSVRKPVANGEVNPNDVMGSLFSESVHYISHIIRSSVITVPLEARLPLSKCEEIYSQLSAVSDPVHQLCADGTIVEESINLFGSVDPSMNLTVFMEGDKARESAIRRLFQTTQAIATYKSESSYSNLRVALNSMSSLLVMSRVVDANLQEISTDVLMVLTAAERSVAALAGVATALCNRAKAGQIVYAEMLQLCSQWHSVVNGEVELAFRMFAMFTRELSSAKILQGSSEDATRFAFTDQLENMIVRTGIKAKYLMERTRRR